MITGAAFAVGIAGCGRPSEIVSREVPKDADTRVASESSAPTAGQTDPADRMLAVLVPAGDRAWFFKLVGPKAEVDKFADGFRSLVKSVRFSEGDRPEPTWDLPDGWVQKPGKTQMRFATISLPQKSKDFSDEETLPELTVVPLEWRPSAYVSLLLANINRWRNQMQLPEARADELADQFETLKLAGGDAMLVDLIGKLSATAMQPPFAGGANRAVPAGHPPIAAGGDVKKATEGKSAEPPTSVSKPSPAAPKPASPDYSDLPMKFQLPEGWTPKDAPQFALAAFSAGRDPGSQIDISITPMVGPGGDVLANINRWRGMVKLPPISEEDVSSATRNVKVGGASGYLVQLTAPESNGPRLAITAALVKHGDATWVFRMRGEAVAVEHEQGNFQKFLDSIQFRDSEQ